MSNPIQLPADFETYDFVAMSKKERNSRNKIRPIAMPHIQVLKAANKISLTQDSSVQILRHRQVSWVF